MPGHPRRQITAKAEERFPLRIIIRVPGHGLGTRYGVMSDWLDEHCGIDGWAIGPAGTHGVQNDAMAVYVGNPTCALAFIARWCLPGDPPGVYDLRETGPERREPSKPHKSPPG
jgi:hypothetical protein